MKKLSYDLNHAGWYGERGQCVSQWGSIPTRIDMKPDQPGTLLRHPTDTVDGEPIWERLTGCDEQDWMEIRNVISQVEFSGRYGQERDSIDWQAEIEKVPGLNPWYPLNQIERQPDHTTWWPWRNTVAAVISSILSSDFPT